MAHQLTLALLESSSSSRSSSSSSSSSDDDNNDRRRDHQASAAAMADGRRERMFEKVVTPSDVGKLNRLVVPKHFAEKHLPLPGAAARAGGTVLCFHDARGGGGGAPSCWRFRYSYWSSSQSYVMTKGWSRYVRDKRLAAGDTVSFCRDGARLFIDCRRRRRTLAPSSSSVLAAPMMPQQQPRVVVADDAVVAMQAEEARHGRCLRLFGVNLLLKLQNAAEPLLLDLQL